MCKVRTRLHLPPQQMRPRHLGMGLTCHQQLNLLFGSNFVSNWCLKEVETANILFVGNHCSPLSGASSQQFWSHCYSCFGFWAHFGFHGLVICSNGAKHHITYDQAAEGNQDAQINRYHTFSFSWCSILECSVKWTVVQLFRKHYFMGLECSGPLWSVFQQNQC